MYFYRPTGTRTEPHRPPPPGELWYKIDRGRVFVAAVGSPERGKPEWMLSVDFHTPQQLLTCPFIVHGVELGERKPSDLAVDIDL